MHLKDSVEIKSIFIALGITYSIVLMFYLMSFLVVGSQSNENISFDGRIPYSNAELEWESRLEFLKVELTNEACSMASGDRKLFTIGHNLRWSNELIVERVENGIIAFPVNIRPAFQERESGMVIAARCVDAPHSREFK